MYEWPHVIKHERSGTLDETMDIKAVAGFVEIHFASSDPYGSVVTLRIPTEGVALLVKKLEAACDAAALMQSANQ